MWDKLTQTALESKTACGRMLIMKKLFWILPFILVSCTHSCSKEENRVMQVQDTVRKFVVLSASSKGLEDRKSLQELAIGELKRAFEVMSEEDFKAHYLGEKITLKNLEIGEPEFDGDRARVKYVITIINKLGKAPTEERNEREAVLSSSRGDWFVDTIRPVGVDTLAFTNGMIL